MEGKEIVKPYFAEYHIHYHLQPLCVWVCLHACVSVPPSKKCLDAKHEPQQGPTGKTQEKKETLSVLICIDMPNIPLFSLKLMLASSVIICVILLYVIVNKLSVWFTYFL